METSFNIEQAIENYIATIASAGSLLPDDARELAGHLTDSVTMLITQGLSEEEAFMVGVGVQADLSRMNDGYPIITPYFVFGLLAGLAGGYISGRFFNYRLSNGEILDAA